MENRSQKIFDCQERRIYHFSEFKISEKSMKQSNSYPKFSISGQLGIIETFPKKFVLKEISVLVEIFSEIFFEVYSCR